MTKATSFTKYKQLKQAAMFPIRTADGLVQLIPTAQSREIEATHSRHFAFQGVADLNTLFRG